MMIRTIDLMANECEYCGETTGVKEVKDLFFENIHDTEQNIHLCDACNKDMKACFE